MPDDPVVNDPVDPVDPTAGDPPADPLVDPSVDLPKANGAGDPPADPAAADDWRASIQDADLQKHAERFTSVKDLTRAHMDLRKELSTAIAPLGKKPTDEQIETYRKVTGVPKTAEGYKFPDLLDGELTDEIKASRTTWAERFHTLNVPGDVAAKLVAFVGEDGAAALTAQIDEDKAYAKETETALKVEWPGKEFKINQKFADTGLRYLLKADVEEAKTIEMKSDRFLLDHPLLLKAFAQLGREVDEGKLGGTMTEGDLDALDTQIDDLEKKIDQATAENDGEKANKLYQEQQELYRKKHGSAPIVGSEGRTA